jgi:hypothetical protein
LGFSKRPLRGKLAGKISPEKKGRKNFGSYGRDLCGREKKIKKAEGQSGFAFPVCPFLLSAIAKRKQ